MPCIYIWKSQNHELGLHLEARFIKRQLVKMRSLG